ncbi:hypothetical protein [Nocardia mexicana]|uniref:Uncharacterized protein n=1 Tax=Nocardia mexicana TaxID=279262 RepID=A0A370HCW6_9NOCA|nr:hypothetical protein [Nocardia mexicana]RDI54557.1 hypothetical protein DFR68_102685 [Nocardia mexicana]
MNMHDMLIPDMSAPNYPHEFDYYTGVGKFAQETLDFLDKFFKSCGKNSEVEPPTAKEAPKIDGSVEALIEGKKETAAVFENYSAVAMQLNQVILDLQAIDKDLAPVAKKSTDLSHNAQREINQMIDLVNKNAQSYPSKGVSENDHILAYSIKAFESGESKLNSVRDGHVGASGEVKKLKDEVEKLKKDLATSLKERKKLEEQLKNRPGGNGNNNNGNNGNGSWNPPPLQNTGNGNGLGTGNADDSGFQPINTGLEDGSKPGGLGGQNGGDNSLDPTGGSKDPTKSLDDAINQITDKANQDTPTPQTPVTPSPMDSGMGGMGGMSPFGMPGMSPFGMNGMNGMGMGMNPYSQQEQMRREQADRDLERRRQEMEMRRSQQQQPAAQAASTNPAPAQTAPAAQQNAGPPQGANAPAGPPPPETPGPDGLVPFTFPPPDSRTVRVSPVVKQGFEVAVADTSGTNAQAAYANTPAKFTDTKHAGAPIDPSQLMSGDIAQWENRTALVVKFDKGTEPGTGDGAMDAAAGGGEPPEVIIAGKPQKLRSEDMATMSDEAGEFGAFVGFKHPRGIDAAPPGGASGAQGDSATGDQSGQTMQAAFTAPS